MIKRIIKIKNCPSFIDFRPTSDLPGFKRYNLIYGWNWSGKTSFSRVLRSFELGKNYYEHTERQPEFKFELDSGIYISHEELPAFNNIRVFNKDFIDENVFGTGGTKSIFFLGKESKEDKEKIKNIEDELNILRPDFETKKLSLEKAKNNKEKKLKEKARDIKNALTTAKQDNYRNYDRGILENIIIRNLKQLKNNEILKLSDKRLSILQKSIQQTSKAKITEIKSPDFDISGFEKTVKDILSKKVISLVIEKLQTDEEINKWVEHGLQIHKDKSLDVCAFCDQKIPEKRFKDLENHFSDEYQKTILSIKESLEMCKSFRLDISFPESSIFYDDLAVEYINEKRNAENAIELFHNRLDSIISLLEQKEKNPFVQLSLEEHEPFSMNSFQNINEIISWHNQKTENFESQINEDKSKLELHYVAEFYPSYREIIEEIKTLEDESSALEKSITTNEEEIKKIKESLITHHIPAQQINKDLEQFLGRNDIQLTATEAKEGYNITRNKEIARNLSEGEKTALAIVYFLTKINEESFDLKNSVVVIDDPVSSLDSNSIFQAFSFIKESIKEAGQIFILTHHFDFFRQVKNWFNHCKKNERQYFMIVCRSETIYRKSLILNMDRLLIDYESEYHFLFSILYRFAKENQMHLEHIYPLPNVARKFLESFLAFRVPLAKNIYQSLKYIENFDQKKRIE